MKKRRNEPFLIFIVIARFIRAIHFGPHVARKTKWMARMKRAMTTLVG
jgi:hypothetical protein